MCKNLWKDGEFAGHLIQLDIDCTTENMFKQAKAVVSLLCEVGSFEGPNKSVIVGILKKASMKRVT